MAAAQREFWIGLVGDSQELFKQLGGTIQDTRIDGVTEQRFLQENGLTLCFYHFAVKPEKEASTLLAAHLMRQNLVIFCMEKPSIALDGGKWERHSYQCWFNVLLEDDFGDQLPLVMPAVVQEESETCDMDLSQMRLNFLLRCSEGITPANPYSSPSKPIGAQQSKKEKKKPVNNVTQKKLEKLNSCLQECKVFQPGQNKHLFFTVGEYATALFPAENLIPEIVPEDYPAACDELTRGKNPEDAALALFNKYTSHWDCFLQGDWWRPHCDKVAQALKTHVNAVTPEKYHDTGHTDPLEQLIVVLKKINEEPKSPLLATYIQYYEEQFLVLRRRAATPAMGDLFKKQLPGRGRTLNFDFDEFPKKRAPSPTASCSFGPFGRKAY
jgi:hypothetical protein